ncbi:MAG: HlyC/CorC family transporter [Fusobacteriaceae bacterium]|jgi:CBS domain containing-hemolysin-like protein|nr:HlyC/CorC family transporter [Fusobacteriaceae bacterium]MBP6467997.1 HlyC/CorC family transporter [Fusobacteriaceae bacterium]MBP9596372.1 HlyC/CorC family transporter [Fusobacteriaceae bacterium]MBU9919093.1 hemolysin family protein [Fusobacteriaceae bacterium]
MFFITKFMIILTLIILSSFFSMAEIALAATKKSKLRVLIEENQVNALKILKLQETPGDYFTVIQIGLNAVAILGGIVGEGILSPYITNLLKDYTNIGVATIETISFLFSFIFVTSFFIEFADLIPKRLAMAYPEKISLKLVNIMIVLMKIFKPVIWIFNGIANTVFKIFKLPITKKEVITSEEIIAVFNEGAEAGVVLEREHYLIENVFELEHRWVSSAMTARDNIIYFLLTETEEEIKEKIAENPHSKFLVCEREIDSIYGYVDAKDILPRILKGEKSGLQNIREITKKSLLIIPNTLTLSEVLDRFNESREDFAIILNEYAHVVGLITLSDVISTLMGDIVYPSQEEYIIKRGENSWLIDGLTPIEDVKKALNIERFPEEDSYETVAGFMMYMLKSIPKKAATLVFEGYTFEVVDVDNFKVDQLLVTKH